MLRSVKDLHYYGLHATDGNMGVVYSVLFEELTWTVRYLVVDTGTWLPGRQVLVAPISLGVVDWETQRISVKLTTDQIKNSPSIDTDKPVSRQHEASLAAHYGWPAYWAAEEFAESRSRAVPPLEMQEPEAGVEGDPHLRSTREVIGYYIEASDGDIGHVEDFIVDVEAWMIRYMVVNTRNWLPGKKVLVAPEWITAMSWGESKVRVDLTRDSIKNSPEFDPSAPVNRVYEEQLYDFYGRPKYWQ